MVADDETVLCSVEAPPPPVAPAATPAASTRPSRLPSPTLSPTFTLKLINVPPKEAGISIEALSDSTVITLCSATNTSPAFTKTSITSTSLKSPMSGTRNSIVAMVCFLS